MQVHRIQQRQVAGACAGLVTCAAVDWFTEWPAAALHEVALHTLADVEADDSQAQHAICQVRFAPMASPLCAQSGEQ